VPERNAEIVRELARLSDAGDFDRMRPLLHPDAIMWGPEGWPERGPMEGREAVVRQYRRLAEDYAERRAEVSDITASRHWVVGRLRWHIRARHSGIESVLDDWFASRFEDGQIIEIRWFWDREEALETAGLMD
jgi:ketosteroid isomerase-like protein